MTIWYLVEEPGEGETVPEPPIEAAIAKASRAIYALAQTLESEQLRQLEKIRDALSEIATAFPQPAPCPECKCREYVMALPYRDIQGRVHPGTITCAGCGRREIEERYKHSRTIAVDFLRE